MEVKSKGHPLISGKSGLVKYLFWPDICHIYVSHGFVSSINFGCSRPDMRSIPPAPNVVQLSKQRCGLACLGVPHGRCREGKSWPGWRGMVLTFLCTVDGTWWDPCVYTQNLGESEVKYWQHVVTFHPFYIAIWKGVLPQKSLDSIGNLIDFGVSRGWGF